MLKIVQSLRDIDFAQLKSVYGESCMEFGARNYSQYHPQQQILLAEQDLFDEVRLLLRDNRAFYGFWVIDNQYVSCLRMEPYLDGYLLEGLETRPDMRNKGFAKALVMSVCEAVSHPIYSHIEKKNVASLAVHRSCGFNIIRNCAVYIDGSVSHRAVTLRR